MATKSFYEFTGNWPFIFDKLVGIISPTTVNKFTIWESRSAGKKHLLIVSEIQLDHDWESRAGTLRISETGFVDNYKNRIHEYVVHGFNEFKGRKPSFILRRLSGWLW